MRRGIVTTNPLYWMPFDIDLWLGQIAGGLRADQKGALMDLLMTSLRQTPPCTLQNDPAYLAAKSGLGRDWKKLSGPILKNFEPITVNGEERLVCGWLRDIYAEQLSKYENRSKANKRNRGHRNDGDGEGTTRTTNRSTNRTAQTDATGTNGGTDRTTNGDAEGTNRSTEVRGGVPPSEVQTTDSGLKESAPAALGLGGRASDRPAEDPYRATDSRVTSESERRNSEARLLADEYNAELHESVERWRVSHGREYEQHRIEAIQSLGLMARDLTPKQQGAIDEQVAVRIQRAEGWLGRSAWITNRQRGKIVHMAQLVESAARVVA